MSTEAEPPAAATPLEPLPENGAIDTGPLERRGSSPPPPGVQLSGASSSASDAGFYSTLDLVLNDLAEPAQLLYDDQRHDEWDYDQVRAWQGLRSLRGGACTNAMTASGPGHMQSHAVPWNALGMCVSGARSRSVVMHELAKHTPLPAVGSCSLAIAHSCKCKLCC